jgi:hypothetical protein
MSSMTANCSSLKKYPQWHNIAAGAIAGAGARFLTAPLDLLVSDQHATTSFVLPLRRNQSSWNQTFLCRFFFHFIFFCFHVGLDVTLIENSSSNFG